MMKTVRTPSSNTHATVEHEGDKFTLVFYRKPVPASRPRVTRFGTYYLKTYKAYKDDAHAAIPVCKTGALTGDLACRIQFVCHKPKSTKRISPLGDIDNHCKAILDALVGNKATSARACQLKKYIEDDMQIIALSATKRFAYDDEEPHTILQVWQC